MTRSVGPYQLVRELGRGGMGVVFEAAHPGLPGRRLALKAILREAADSPDALARFRREAETLARVHHPNVVAVHAMDVASEGPYLVTDYVEGRPLHEVARARPMGFEEAARLARALCDAVAALHAAGVLHRDIKPHNVMLRPDGQPVLLDFGLARDLRDRERLTVTGALMGTPVYMAPEQADGASPSTLGPTVDVYALGAVLLECLSGAPPFDEQAGPLVTLRRVLTEAPRWPSQLRRNVPEALEAICRVAMAKAPGARYPTAEAMRADLDLFLKGEPPWALGRAPRDPFGAGRALALAGGAAVLVAALVVGLVLTLARGEAAPPTEVAPVATRRPSPPPPTAPPPAATRTTESELLASPEASLPKGQVLVHPPAAFMVFGIFVDRDTAFTWDANGGAFLWSFTRSNDPAVYRELPHKVLAAVSDGEAIFVRQAGRVRRLDRTTLEPTHDHAFEERPLQGYEERRPLALSPDGVLVLVTDREIAYLRPEDLSVRRDLPALALPAELELWPTVAAIDEDWLVVGEGRLGVEVGSKRDWKAGLNRDKPDDRFEGASSFADLDNPMGDFGHGLVLRWARSGGPPERAPSDRRLHAPVCALAIHPQTAVVAWGGFGGLAFLWPPGREAVHLVGEQRPDAVGQPQAHAGNVPGVVFLGKHLLTVGSGTRSQDAFNQARLWDERGGLIATHSPLRRMPRGLALSPDGERLLVSMIRQGDATEAQEPTCRAEVWPVAALYERLGVKRSR